MFKNKNKADIIFLIIVFVLLFIPGFYLDDNDVSKRENRHFVKYKRLIRDNGSINYSYGQDLEKYFTDHFFMREKILSYYNFIRLTLSYRNNLGIIDKQSGFMYFNNEHEVVENLSYVDKFIQLYKFYEFLNKHGIKLYVVIVPQKCLIYESKALNVSGMDKINDNFIKYVDKYNSDGKLNIIYPYEEMIKAKNDNYMFFKTDHHWTDDGAFVAYKILMERIKKDFPNVRIVKSSDFDYFKKYLIRKEFRRDFVLGSIFEFIGLPYSLSKHYHNTSYRYYKHKNQKLLVKKVFNEYYNYSKEFTYPEGSDIRVLLMGTSNNENLLEILPYSFKNLKYIRTNGVKGIGTEESNKVLKYYEKSILEYKPDILIFCITTRNFGSLENLFNKE